MNENTEAYILGGIGAIKGIYEIYKPITVEEKIETAGLLVVLGSTAVIGYLALKNWGQA